MSWLYQSADDIVGKTVSHIIKMEDDDAIRFVMTDGSVYEMLHTQDCCESVCIQWNESCNIEDLIGTTIIKLDEETGDDTDESDVWCESSTKTIYNFKTNNGTYKIVWFGCSNDYYSETPEFYKIKG